MPQIQGMRVAGPHWLPRPSLQPHLVSKLQPGLSPGPAGLLSYANCCSTQLEIVPTEVGTAPASWHLCETCLLPGKPYLEGLWEEGPRKASVGELMGGKGSDLNWLLGTDQLKARPALFFLPLAPRL